MEESGEWFTVKGERKIYSQIIDYHILNNRSKPFTFNRLPCTEKMNKTQTYISWTAQILAALILGQTLFFKFTGAAESVELFTKLGVEPYGRYFTGTMELIAVILLLSPRRAWMGALLGIGLMLGAIGSHILVLGIMSMGDGGYLFFLAIITLICCLTVAYIHKNDIFAQFYFLT